MRNGATIAVIIPALNEEQSIGEVVKAIPKWVDDIIVVDNGSMDRTVEVALAGGARVAHEPRRGYGSACLTGIASLKEPNIVVFLDGDYSDYPDEMGLLVDPIIEGRLDMVVGSRVLGARQPGALTPQARFGNWLACALMRLFWKAQYTDLGPFRAISCDALASLNMRDKDYGWTIEMQIKAIRRGLRIEEAPVSYRKRIGKSKVSGTVRGVFFAGKKILGTIFRSAIRSSLCEAQFSPWQEVILFSRYPEPGKTKTRLIPSLGPDKAARLQYLMTEHALRRINEFSQSNTAHVEIRFDGGSRALMKSAFGAGPTYLPQGDGDLGFRMARAFAEAFRIGMKRVVIIGSDCPQITSRILEEAFHSLLTYDIVLGPATDGGYYLIGLKRYAPTLFIDIPWGTDQVLAITMEQADQAGLSITLLEELSDIDRPEDMEVWEKAVQENYGRSWDELDTNLSKKSIFSVKHATDRNSTPMNLSEIPIDRADSTNCELISVIIPTLNEEAYIPATLLRALQVPNVELVVIDGGSADRTTTYARNLGAQVITSTRGRAAQMNEGAKVAQGDILLFLHADTLLPDGWADRIREVLALPDIACGAFEFRLDAMFPGSRVIERLTNLRSYLFHMPYGDQAIFVKSDLFHKIGGYPNLPIMEDFELVRRLRNLGNVGIAPFPAMTSARRWRQVGACKTTLVNQLVIVAYMAGLSPNFTARLRNWAQGS